MVSRDGKVNYSAGFLFVFFLFLFCRLSLGLVVWQRISDPFVSQNKYIGFGLLWFYGISTIVGYLMLNTYMLNIHVICKHILLITCFSEHELSWTQLNGFKYCYITVQIQQQSFVWTQLNGFKYCYLTVTIQQQSFVWIQFVLFDSLNPIRCYYRSSVWTWERYQWRGSPNLQSWSLYLSNVISRILIAGGSYPSAEMQSVYFTAPVNWTW